MPGILYGGTLFTLIRGAGMLSRPTAGLAVGGDLVEPPDILSIAFIEYCINWHTRVWKAGVTI